MNPKLFYLEVQIKTNSKINKIEGWHNHRLKIALKAAPIEGKANAALISFLAETLNIPKSHIEITKGETSKLKTIQLPYAMSQHTLFKATPQINHTHQHR